MEPAVVNWSLVFGWFLACHKLWMDGWMDDELSSCPQPGTSNIGSRHTSSFCNQLRFGCHCQQTAPRTYRYLLLIRLLSLLDTALFFHILFTTSFLVNYITPFSRITTTTSIYNLIPPPPFNLNQHASLSSNRPNFPSTNPTPKTSTST